jgi:hypothetical protein
MPRKLRIAVSVFFGLLTVALCVLWVRSFWRMDLFSRFDTYATTIYSNDGVVGLTHQYSQPVDYVRPMAKSWRVVSTNADGRYPKDFWKSTQHHFVITAPHLVLALVPATIAISPWVRFSLRTLLIAMTWVAVLLGLAAWARR